MANRTKFAGWYRAVDYYYGGPFINNSPAPLTIITAPAATGAGTVTLSQGPITLTDGTIAYPLATNAPVLVGNGSVTETVTPSAVSNPTDPAPGSASFTATFSNLHGRGANVASGTCGLMEAINDCARNGGGIVVIDAAWTLAGGTAAMYVAAMIANTSGLVTIQDNRAGGGEIQNLSQTIVNADVLTLFSVGKILLPAPGAGNMWDIIQMVVENKFLTAAYAAGGAIQLTYGNSGVTIPATATIAATFLTSPVADQVIKVAGALATNLSSDILNKAVSLNAATANFTTGAGSLRVRIAYRLLTGL